MIDLPCPSCGFLTLEDFYGSYAICPICNWEDDGVQLANPTSNGGATASLWRKRSRMLSPVSPLASKSQAAFAADLAGALCPAQKLGTTKL